METDTRAASFHVSMLTQVHFRPIKLCFSLTLVSDNNLFLPSTELSGSQKSHSEIKSGGSEFKPTGETLKCLNTVRKKTFVK